MHTLNFFLGLAIVGTLMVVTTAKPADAASLHTFTHRYTHPCGENMYHHNGKCVDARDNGSASWTDRMSAKKAQW